MIWSNQIAFWGSSRIINDLQLFQNFNFSFPSFAILSFIMFLPSFCPSSCLLVNLSMSLIPPSRVWGLMGRWVVWPEHGQSGLPLKQHPQRLTQLCCNPLTFQLLTSSSLLFFYFLSDESSNVRSACCSLTIYKLAWTPGSVLDIRALFCLWGCEVTNEL